MRYRIVIVEERDYRNLGSLNKGYDAMPKSKDTSRRIYAVLLDEPDLDLADQKVIFIKLPGGIRPDYIDDKIEKALGDGFNYYGIYTVIDDKVKPSMVPDGNIGVFSEMYPEQYRIIKDDIKQLPYVPTREDIIKRIRRRLARMRELTWSHERQRKEAEAKENKRKGNPMADQDSSNEPRIPKPLLKMIATVTNMKIGKIMGGSVKDIPSSIKTGVLVPSESLTKETRNAVKKKIERVLQKKYGIEAKIDNPESLNISLVPYKE